LEENEIKKCIVKIKTNDSHGTGFFINTNKILTCFHVIKGYSEIDIKVIFNGEEYSIEIIDKKEEFEIDLAILKIEIDNTKFLKIDKRISYEDDFLTYGFADDEYYFEDAPTNHKRGLVPVTLDYEGNDDHFMKFKNGQVEEGHSGSPVINLTTKSVCGVLKITRNGDSSLGGYGIPIDRLELLDIDRCNTKKVVDMIDIEIAVKKNDTLEQKGDLIESFVSTLVKYENYQIKERVENNGIEISLLYEGSEKNKIYIEFKNYKHDTVKIETIKNIIGTQAIEGYEKVCLISTTELENNTNELVLKLKNEQKRDDIMVYTPSTLIEVLESTRTIVNYDNFEKPLEKNKNFTKNYTRGKTVLIVSEYGYFYVSIIQENNEEIGIVLYHAETGQLIEDTAILNKVLNLDTSFKDSDFYFIENFREETRNKREIVPLDINKLELENKYLRKLQDIGVKFNHPHKKDKLILDDVFVYQDLEIVKNESENKKIFLEINAHELEDISMIGHIIIYGSHASGKSTLSKKLQLKYIEERYIPILLKGKEIKSNSFHSEKIKKLVLKSFKQQYKNVKSKISDIDKQLNKDKIILIIDDFQSVKFNTEYKSEFIKSLVGLEYKNIIIFADETLQLEATTESKLAESLLEFTHYKILEMGHKVRDRMIKKWLSLGVEREIDSKNLILKTREKAKLINTTVGYNLVPTYPFYILTLLQAMESNESILNESSSYGHYYRFLIMQYLNSDSVMESKDITTINSYVSTFAFECLTNLKYMYSEAEFLEFHSSYCIKKKFRPSFDIIDKLIKSMIISVEDGVYKFSQDYLYYYFVAQYFSDNINNVEVRDIIDKMCERLYNVEFSNIIMFLMHHSPQSFILEKLVLEAQKIFQEENEFSFSRDELVHFNQLLNKERKYNEKLEKRTLEETREQELEEEEQNNNGRQLATIVDEVDNDEEIDYNEEIKELDRFQKFNLASKMIEILGEIVKNYSGLDGSIKTNLINEIYKLGLRSNKSIISFIEENHTLILEIIEQIIEKKNYATEEEKKKVAGEIVFNVALSHSIGILKKISKAIASEELTIVNNEIFENSNDNMAIKLIKQAIELDFRNGLNIKKVKSIHHQLKDENNTLSDSVLKRLVLEHLYMFDKQKAIKQSACSAVGIEDDSAKQELIEASKR
jgi:hypothetical protein